MNNLDSRKKEPVKIGEAVITCPVCGSKSLEINDYLYEIPLVGKVILSTGKCRKCGYKYNDVRLAETGNPRRITIHVESPDDLNVIVIRASSASIIIPEKGLEMHPGPASQGFITTIEGVLERFREAVELACKDPSADRKKCREILEWLDEARNAKKSFTIVIEDPEGVSTIASPKARVEPLSHRPKK